MSNKTDSDSFINSAPHTANTHTHYVRLLAQASVYTDAARYSAPDIHAAAFTAVHPRPQPPHLETLSALLSVTLDDMCTAWTCL